MIESIFQHATSENFFGAVVALCFLSALWWILRNFSAGQSEIVKAIESQAKQTRVHGALLLSMQMTLLADKPGEFAAVRVLLEDIRKQLGAEQ